MNDLFFHDLALIQRDPEQWSAFRSKHNTALIAGPGSGKTRVLALKAVSLIMSEIKRPSGLACISYSRETVRELKKRLKSYGLNPGRRDFVGTVHSFSLLHVIDPFAKLFSQYKVKYPVKIMPDEVESRIYNGVLGLFKLDRKDVSLVDINRCRILALDGMSTVAFPVSRELQDVAVDFERRVLATDYIDFTAIITIAAKMIREQDFVRQAVLSRFPWLLVDEYQDLGKALHEMVLELVFHADLKLFAVGDMNQSIYGFNGGYPHFFEELTKYADITSIHLMSNYRSTEHIIEASKVALPPSPLMPTYLAKHRTGEPANFSFITCESEMGEQYDVVASKVIPKLLLQGISLNEIGILTASNGQAAAMAAALQAKRVGFYIAKWDFENSAVVVWLQDCASWCINAADQAFDDIFDWWRRILITHKDLRANWEAIRLKMFFRKVLDESKVFDRLDLWLRFITTELKLAETLYDSDLYPNEVANLDTLLREASAKNLRGASITRFSKLGYPDNEVTISTRHSSKGLEFETVIMLGMEEEKFPYYSHLNRPDLLAEDQRLCYVCISRAKSNCILIRSKTYDIETRRGTWHKEYAPSRFWVALHAKFGTKANTFTNSDFH